MEASPEGYSTQSSPDSQTPESHPKTPQHQQQRHQQPPEHQPQEQHQQTGVHPRKSPGMASPKSKHAQVELTEGKRKRKRTQWFDEDGEGGDEHNPERSDEDEDSPEDEYGNHKHAKGRKKPAAGEQKRRGSDASSKTRVLMKTVSHKGKGGGAGGESEVFACGKPGCLRSYNTWNELSQHLKVCGVLPCRCGYAVNRSSDFVKHQKGCKVSCPLFSSSSFRSPMFTHPFILVL